MARAGLERLGTGLLGNPPAARRFPSWQRRRREPRPVSEEQDQHKVSAARINDNGTLLRRRDGIHFLQLLGVNPA